MTVEAPAKVNFTLEVFGKRSDGYHALRSVVMPISLCDTIEIEPAEAFSTDTGYPDDLCLKAARVLANAGGRNQPVRIRVTKRIPAGGGLGGGSADAAAVLVALNDLWQLGLTRAELAGVGAQVGSDVPALVLGGPVLMEGRGEKVTPIFPHPSSLNLVLSNPGVPSSTPEVYAACTPRTLEDASATDAMISALVAGDIGAVAASLQNDLQEPAVRLHPEIADAISSLRTAGAKGVLMSGSGSSVFGLVPDEATAVRIAAQLNARGLRSWSVHTLV